MDTMQAGGLDAPLSMGEQWTAMHLFETILLASMWSRCLQRLVDRRWRLEQPEVTQAIADYEKILSYTNSDASALSWQDAGQLVIDGDAAFNVMGDWQEGFFRELGAVPGEGYVWAPVPGTAGNFQFSPTASSYRWVRPIVTPPLPG
ncbi:MAG: hypothetical protein M5U34_01355 [Chloroflexi bacterium]|nr:hypothetical protein [Chloroflexota bacterium]